MLANWSDTLEGVSATFLAIAQKELVFSTILFAIVLALSRILRKQSPYLHYGLWALVLLRLVLPPDLSSQFSARSFFARMNVLDDFIADPPLVQESPSAHVELPQVRENNKTPEVSEEPASVVTTDSALSTNVSWKVWLFLLWCSGILVFAALYLRRYLLYYRIVKEAHPVIAKDVLRIVETWSKRFDIKRATRVVSSDVCLSPFTLGILKPAIYVPDVMLKRTNSSALESVLAHELAHVRNWDDLWIKVQNVIQLLYFFHPVVWLISSRINQTRERICDDLVLSYGTITPKAYAGSMLSVLKLNLQGTESVEMLPSFGNHKEKFSDRIREITNISQIRKANMLVTCLVLGALAILLLPMAEMSGGSTLDANGRQVVNLTRHVNEDGEFGIHVIGAGSSFQKIAGANASHNDAFCDSKLPLHLTEVECAAIGLYDTDYKKHWVLKGINEAGKTEFYVDTDGDVDFRDEKPLRMWKKTAKYLFEGNPEWKLTKFLKSHADIDYIYLVHSERRKSKLGVFLVYQPERNFLEFLNTDFWLGRARFGENEYDIALYGGLQSGWYLRPTFDESPGSGSQNEFRIDLNQNKQFEDMTVFDPASNRVVQERFKLSEPFSIDGRTYRVESVSIEEGALKAVIAPVTGDRKTGHS